MARHMFDGDETIEIMTKMIEGLRHIACGEHHIGEERFNAIVGRAVKAHPEPPPSADASNYFLWSELIVAKVCAALPGELT